MTMPTNQETIPVPPPPAEGDVLYECIGVCMADPASGLCQGCGRPLAEPQAPESDDPA